MKQKEQTKQQAQVSSTINQETKKRDHDNKLVQYDQVKKIYLKMTSTWISKVKNIIITRLRCRIAFNCANLMFLISAERRELEDSNDSLNANFGANHGNL